LKSEDASHNIANEILQASSFKVYNQTAQQQVTGVLKYIETTLKLLTEKRLCLRLIKPVK